MESLNSDSDANHNPKTDEANPKLELGKIFQNKKEFKEADTTHEIKRGRMVEWIKDDSVRAMGAYKPRLFLRYRQMERTVLSGEIAGLDLRGAAVTYERIQEVDLSETVRRMEESIPKPILLLEAAVKRCINVTSGSEVDKLILVLNDVTLQYISTLQENAALKVSALRLVDIPEKARKLLNLLEESKDSRGKKVFDELDDDSVVSWTSVIVGLSVASSHQGDSGLIEVPVRAFHSALHDKTKDTGLSVASSHQGDSGLIEVPVRAFHSALHDKTKDTGEAVSPSLELH
ncbi:hypothetical protein BC332_12794 [Capsicum chinense]|nr:hypothetical protein BC332_12794 [Capsicum chinense]